MFAFSLLVPQDQNLYCLLLISVFAFGLCWGSFLNVVIHRLPKGEDLVFTRSHCPQCKKLIRWYQNVPVLSWIFLRAKCAECKSPISARYPAVELLTGLLFLAAAYKDPNMAAWPVHFYFLASLIAASFIDIDHWILPDKITLPGIVVGLLCSIFISPPGLLFSILGVLIGGGVLYLTAWLCLVLMKKEGLGGGDIKFLAMIGAFVGPTGVFTTMVLSSLLGSVIGIALILIRGRKNGGAFQFGPFLALGALAAFFFGESFWQWYFYR